MVSIVIIEYHSLNEICKFAEISNMFTNNTDNELIVSSNSQYSASKQTKIKEEYPDSKIIMVSAAGQQHNMIEAVQNGAAEFISKPFEIDAIKKVVRNVLES